MAVPTSHFGTIDLRDDEVLVADGGIHGVQGHRILIRGDGKATWARRLDSFDPVGAEGEGEALLDATELAQLHAWADAAWRVGENEGAAHLALSSEPEIQRWVWVVAVCRDGETQVLEGGGISDDTAPADLAGLLAWLRERVDALASR